MTGKRIGLLVIRGISASLALLGVLSLDTSRSTASEWRFEREVNMLLRVESDNVRRNIDHLFSHTNVTLANQHSGVMDRLRKAKLENLSLKSTLQKVLDLESEHVIKLHLVFREHADAHQSTQKSISLEETLWVLLVQGQQGSRNFTHLSDGEFDTPDFTLVTKTVLADQFQFLVESRLFVAARGGDKGLRANQ